MGGGDGGSPGGWRSGSLRGGEGSLGGAAGYRLTWRAAAAPRPGGPGVPFLLCIFQARCPGHGPHTWPCPVSSPGAYGRARALPEPCAPRRRSATADPGSSVSGVATLLLPRPLGTTAPKRGHWTCGACRIETTTPESQCASARARCGAVGGATSGSGKRRGVSGKSWRRAQGAGKKQSALRRKGWQWPQGSLSSRVPHISVAVAGLVWA